MSKSKKDHTYYEVLELNKKELDNLDEDDVQDIVKKQYKRLSKRYHPDNAKTGDAEKFKLLNEANQVLQDQEKRNIYNRYGKDGLSGNPMPSNNPFRSFSGSSSFPFPFPFENPFAQEAMHPRTQDTVIGLKVNLKQLYTGCTKKVEFTALRNCPKCNSSNAKGGSGGTCRKCKGKGMMMIKINRGSINQLVQKKCSDCNGSGEYISHKCDYCQGNRVRAERNSLMVDVLPGMKNKENIIFEGLSHEQPGFETGDLKIVLKLDTDAEIPFERKKDDLFYNCKIKLGDALCGFSIVIPHLSGKKLYATSYPGEVVYPGMMKKIIGKGMPIFNENDTWGDLYVKFEIEFPNSLNSKKVKKLAEILPQTKSPQMTKEMNEVDLDDFVESQMPQYYDSDNNNKEEDSDDETGPDCTTQ